MTFQQPVIRNTSLPDHIGVYLDVLARAQCEELIARFEASEHKGRLSQDGGHSFEQIDITQHWPDENARLVPVFLSQFNRYQAALNALYWPTKFAFEHLRIKRYLPNGRDEFPTHVDVMGQTAARRFMTAIIYLNTTIGGETVFPNLGISIAPECGKLIAFPPLWLFPHAGLPTKSGPKYILHTYLCYPS